MKPAIALFVAAALTGCSGGGSEQEGAAAALERAAIDRGLISDPATQYLPGLYARDTDRVCIVPTEDGHRIGAFADYGERMTCTASGSVRQTGSRLDITLGDPKLGCNFEGQFEGEQIRFPGSMPEGCKSLCSGRAAFDGLEVTKLSSSLAEARALRDPSGTRHCSN